MTIRVLLVSLLVAGSLGHGVSAAAVDAPAVRLVEDYSLLDFRAGTSVDDQVGRTSEGPGPAFADVIGASVTAPSGTGTAKSRGRNLAVLGAGEEPALLEIDAMASIRASATTGNSNVDGNPYADAWSVYSADFTVVTTVPYILDMDIAASSNDTNQCTYVEASLTGPEGVVYERTLGVGAVDWCDGDNGRWGALSGSLVPGEYRLVLDVFGEVDDSTAPASTTAHAGANLQLGRGCDNDPKSYGGTVTGTAADDVLCGGLGGDVIEGLGGDDLILAGPGEDDVAGGGGRDLILGGPNADRITGGRGADAVEAGAGDDVVRACDDTKDVLSGQRGTDKVFRDPVDVLTGFETRTAC